MDLIALIAACALTADPKVMHALIWHQSGGEPWSVSVPGERQPRVYGSAREAVAEARTSAPSGVPIRVGLTGLAVDSEAATLARLMPCPNISIAAQQIVQLSERCKSIPLVTAHPIHCAVAAYRGSWDYPDNKFADAVLTSVSKGDAPNFDMPDDIGERADNVATDLSVAGERNVNARSVAADDQQRGWSSALFPAKSKPFDATNSSGENANRSQELSTMAASPTAAPSHDNGLFVRRVPERRPQ